MPTETDKKVLVEPRDTYDWVSRGESYPAHNRADIRWGKVAGCGTTWQEQAFPGPNTTAIPTEARTYQGHGEELEKHEDWVGDVDSFWALCDSLWIKSKRILQSMRIYARKI